jgi:hypothetical protein
MACGTSSYFSRISFSSLSHSWFSFLSLYTHNRPPFCFQNFSCVYAFCVCVVCFSILIRERKEIQKKGIWCKIPEAGNWLRGYFILFIQKSVSGFRFCLLYLSSLVEFMVLKMCILLHQLVEVVIFCRQFC